MHFQGFVRIIELQLLYIIPIHSNDCLLMVVSKLLMPKLHTYHWLYNAMASPEFTHMHESYT